MCAARRNDDRRREIRKDEINEQIEILEYQLESTTLDSEKTRINSLIDAECEKLNDKRIFECSA